MCQTLFYNYAGMLSLELGMAVKLSSDLIKIDLEIIVTDMLAGESPMNIFIKKEIIRNELIHNQAG